MSDYSDIEDPLMPSEKRNNVDWLAPPPTGHAPPPKEQIKHKQRSVYFADDPEPCLEGETEEGSDTIGHVDGGKISNGTVVEEPRKEPPRRPSGALRQTIVHHQSMLELFSGFQRSKEHGGGRFHDLRFLVPILNSLLLLLVVSYLVPAVVLGEHGLDLFKETSVDVIFDQLVTGLSSIPVIIFLSWASSQITKNFEGTNNRPHPSTHGEVCLQCLKSLIPGRTSFLLMLTVLLRHLVLFMNASVNESFQASTELLVNTGLAFSFFALWVSGLDDFVQVAHRHAEKMDSIAAKTSKSQKFKMIMREMAKFEKPELDRGYAIPGGSRSPARVLSEVVGVYCTIAKAAGMIVLFLYIIGIDLYKNLVIISLSLFLTGAVAALHINFALANLIPLALSNTFHIGEIISISQTGSAPGDNPAVALCGFVEGVTWSHVVIRDFRRKQVFVPHSEMQQMTISNWTRRPSKVCRVVMTVEPGLSRGAAGLAALAKFTVGWMKRHPDIDQENYLKAALKMTELGQPLMEVIFYPKIGSKLRPVRAELVVMLMDASKRLNLCLMPAERRPTTSWSTDNPTAADEDDEDDDIDLSDLFPSSRLTRRAGQKPKFE